MKKLLIIFLALFMADNAFARFNFSKAYAKAREHAYAEAREKSTRERLATSDIKPYGAPYHASKIVLDSLRMGNYERLLKRDENFENKPAHMQENAALVYRNYHVKFLP